MPPSRHGNFYLTLILPVKMVKLPQQHANDNCPWLQTLPLPIAANSSILNVAEFLDPSLKTLPFMKTSKFFFLIISKCCHFYQKPLCFSLLLFTLWWRVFKQPFRQLLQLSCFYGSSQWFKVKITCKRVSFIKK